MRLIDQVSRVYAIGAHDGVQAWLWLLTLWGLLHVAIEMHWAPTFSLEFAWRAPSAYAVTAVLLYLSLSELFYLGFLGHPYGGYFLSVHASHEGGPNQPAELGCQPTTSSYCPISALATMNLTYHVEHHDFPRVPWARLPQIRRLAPSFCA